MILHGIGRARKRCRGQALVDYALIISLVSLMIVSSATAMSTQISFLTTFMKYQMDHPGS